MAARTDEDVLEVSGVNCVVLRGTVANVPEVRELSSGKVVTTLNLSTTTSAGTWSVPVSFEGLLANTIIDGSDVVVVGAVRRRFFRAAGSVQSRTEVSASKVVASRNRATARRVVDTMFDDVLAMMDL
jgi:single-stranded DNA-binding protein